MPAAVARSVTTRLTIDARGWVAGGQLAQRTMRETSRVAQQGAREAIRAFREQQAAQERAAAAAERAAQRAAREQTRAAQQAARDAERAARQQEAATKRAAAEAERSAARQMDAYDKVGTVVGAAGLAIGAGLGAAISKSADFEAAMSGAAAATGLTGRALDALEQTAIRAGASTQYSATEAADAITAMAKAGISAGDIMGGGLTGALSLAAAGQLDVAQAAEIAATAMTQFGLKGSDLPHVADLLAAAAGKAQGSVQDMGLAMNYVGPVAKGMGISIEETSGAIAELASQGIIGEQAGTGLRGVLSSLAAPSKAASEQMDALGINLYDANGRFIGVRGAAEELHRTLGPLDEATRNAALGQLFGNEQLTAARILYEGGGRAVDEWTAKVDDAGFAAEQAARLTDNLKGDVERLGGALDTALIGSGQDANGVLREMVQLGTGALDIYNSLPGPVKTTGTAFASLAGAVGLTAGGLLLAAPRIKATKEALNDMGRVGTTLQRGLSGTASILGGPWGLALGAATVGLGYWADKHADAVKFEEDFRSALDQTTGALTEQATALAAQKLQQDGAFRAANQLGISTQLITQAATGNANAQRQLTAEMNARYDATAALVQMSDAEQARNADAVVGAQDQRNALEKLRGSVGGVSQSTAEAQEKQRQLLEAMGDTTGAAGTAEGGVRGMAAGTAAMSAKAVQAETDLNALKDALQGVYDSAFAAEGSADAFHSALNGLKGAVDRNGTSLKGNSDKAIGNREAMRNATQAAIRHLQTMADNGATTDEVSGKAKAYAAELKRQAIRLGLNKTDVEHYSGALKDVPKEIKSHFSTPGLDEANTKLGVLQTTLAEIARRDHIDVSVAIGIANKVSSNPRLAAPDSGDGYGDLSQPVRRWTGGQVHGPGGPRDDQIPALLSNREWVHPVAAVDQYGPRFMRAVQTGQFPVELAQAFADGGQVNIIGRTTGKSVADALSPVARALRAAADEAGGMLGGAPGAGKGMGYQAQMAILRGQFPGLALTSGFRPGAITATGNRSYHSMGRAVDVPPRMDVFNWIRENYGRSTKELIFSPAGNRQVWNGRPHYYTGVTRRMHFNHVHWAMNRGGQVGTQDRYAGAWGRRPQRFATGGQVLGADYSGISSIVSERVTITRDDVKRAREATADAEHDVRAATHDLAKARRELAKAHTKAEKKAAEDALEKATKDLAHERLALSHRRRDQARTERDYATGTRPLSTRFHEAAVTRNRVTAGFLRNLQTLASRGFGDLARQLSEMGGADAETLAAQAVASTKVARTLQSDLTRSAGLAAQAEGLPARLAITSALKTMRNPTIAGLSQATGIAASDLQAAAMAMRGSLGRNANAKALLSGLGTNTTTGGFGTGAGGDQITVQVTSTGNPWRDGERALAGAKRVKSVSSMRRF